MTILPDIQAQVPEFKVAINRVGVENVILPIIILQKDGGYQHSVANISCFVDLYDYKRGADMSRLQETLHQYVAEPLSVDLLDKMSEEIIKRSNASLCELIYKFPYFITKTAPVSKLRSISHYDVVFDFTRNKELEFCLSVTTTAMSLCPCSKEISTTRTGHNQRVDITIRCRQDMNNIIWIEDLAMIAESCASCSTYNILKRVDEALVVDTAYNNPKFVEDISRHVYYEILNRYSNINYFDITISSRESIHQHNAFSKIVYDSRSKVDVNSESIS